MNMKNSHDIQATKMAAKIIGLANMIHAVAAIGVVAYATYLGGWWAIQAWFLALLSFTTCVSHEINEQLEMELKTK